MVSGVILTESRNIEYIARASTMFDVQCMRIRWQVTCIFWFFFFFFFFYYSSIGYTTLHPVMGCALRSTCTLPLLFGLKRISIRHLKRGAFFPLVLSLVLNLHSSVEIMWIGAVGAFPSFFFLSSRNQCTFDDQEMKKKRIKVKK